MSASILRYGTYLFYIIILVLLVSLYYFITALDPVKVGVLGEGENSRDDTSSFLAFQWLKQNSSFDPVYLSFNDLNEAKLNELDLLWFHKEDSLEFGMSVLDHSTIQLLQTYIEKGGKLLLSQEAALYISALELVKQPPGIKYILAEDGGYGRKMGLHSFLGHPVFKGLHGGAFIFGPDKDILCRQIGYFGEHIPQNLKTIAVDWAYIRLKEQSRLMLEFERGKGKVISIGSYMMLGIHNQQEEQMNRFLFNTLQYLNSGESGDENYWPDTSQKVKLRAYTDSTWLYQQDTSWAMPDLSALPHIYSRAGGAEYMEVSGQRMLLMGLEKGGIEEIWAHPYMALRDYEAGLSFDNGENIYWLSEEEPEIWVYPGIFLRQYKFKRAYLREWITVAPEKPQAIMRYEYRGVYPAKFYFRFRSNLRRMWPYSENTTGDILYSWDSVSRAFVLQNGAGDMVSVLSSSKEPDWKHLGPADEERQIPFTTPEGTEFTWGFTGAASYNLGINEDFYFAFSATSEGLDKAISNLREIISQPRKIFEQARKHSLDLLNNKTIIKSPDTTFNEAYTWALLAADKFMVETPGLGTALVAGYASSAHGWDGAQKVSGRPGYSWYFGRDGQWSSMALLDYGDFENVRKQLEFYLKFQDVNGKIFHEISTSGVVHYDAADATPLFIVLAGKYLRHSGDLGFIREYWPGIEKAMQFCYSTDVNKDKLIENVNVGHAWVEGGGLYGSQSTLYLTSCWAKALEEAAYMSEALGMDALSDNYTYDAMEISKIINEDFWNEKDAFFYHGKYPDGSYNPELTVMPTIPVYFRQIEQNKIAAVLDRFAGNGFSSDWGVRIVPEYSDLFHPYGYHTGSVWPLYTGWTALAEYEGGFYIQGFQHIMNNLHIYKHWGRGYIEEVLNGMEYQPSGVCRHQCWSETMALQPILEGMLGFKPDALSHSLELSPALPPNWDSFSLENLRIGKTNISMKMDRDSLLTRYYFQTNTRKNITLNFEPVFPPGTEFGKISWRGRPVEYLITEEAGGFKRLELNLNVGRKGELTVYHHGGICVLPLVSEPQPGNKSRGFRLLKQQLTDDEYILNFEGKGGNTESFSLYCRDWQPSMVKGAALIKREGNIYTYRLRFDPGEGYMEKELVIQLLQN